MNGSKFTLGHPLRWISPDESAPPGSEAHSRGVVFLDCSGLIEPLASRRSSAPDLAFHARSRLATAKTASTPLP
jgi:hypothetical protein